MSATSAKDHAVYDIYITDKQPAISVVKDDGAVKVTRWRTINEGLAYLAGCGCDTTGAADDRQLIEKAIDAKYSAFG